MLFYEREIWLFADYTLKNQSMYHGVNLQKNKKISRNAWTNEEYCGKICNGEQPGFYTWRLDRFGPAKGGCHMTLAEIFMCSIALCQLVIMVIALFQGK